MTLSVILTTYNRPEALRKVLDALNYQTMPADDVLVADDGSTPETRRMIVDLTAELKYPVTHVWHEDLGFRAAEIRNKALHKSSGDYIVLLDGDCIPARHFIEDHLRMAEKGYFIQGKRVLVSRRLSPGFSPDDAFSIKKLFKYGLTGGISNSHHIIRLPFLPAHISNSMNGIKTCNMGFHRQDIFAVNGFNQDFVGWGREDSELAVRFYKYGLKRKTHSFMAICFHLWHQENDRTRLPINDDILEKAITSKTYQCANGLTNVQSPSPRP